MSKKIGLLNEKVIKGQLKELVRGSVEENRYVKVVIVSLTVGMIMRKSIHHRICKKCCGN